MQPFPMTAEGIKQNPVAHAAGTLAIEHHIINPVQLLPVATKTLSYYPFYTVSIYCQACILLRYSQTQSGRCTAGGSTEYRKTVIRTLDWTLKNGTILCWL